MRLLFLASLVSLVAAHSASVVRQAARDGNANVEGTLRVRAASGAVRAGDLARQLCESLPTSFNSSLNINNTFAQYYPEGSNPSLEQLAASYPAGTIPQGFDVDGVLRDVGPDIDITKDFGYGKSRGQRAARNGPLGGLPAFCRFGAFIITSPLTAVLTEVWLPLAPNSSIPLAPASTDYPTDTTPVEVSEFGTYEKAPRWMIEASAAGAARPALALASAEPEELDEREEAKPELQAHPLPRAEPAKPELQLHPLPRAEPAKPELQLHPLPRAEPSMEERQDAPKILAGDDVLGTSTGWNGRLMYVANGGQRGFVPLTELKQVMNRYRFAVAGSNAGHFSSTGGVTWVPGPQYNDTLLDFGSRSTHVSKILLEEVAVAFYGSKTGVRVQVAGKPQGVTRLRAYMGGCSVGGGRAMASVQVYPRDFDGLLAGAPAIGFNRMNRGQIHTQSTHRKSIVGEGYFPLTTLQGPVHEVILSQCDGKDGVVDGVVSFAKDCKPRFEDDLLCGKEGAKFGGSNETCLTQLQIDNLYELYRPTVLNGTQVYPRYLPGLEQQVAGLTGVAAKAISWFQLAILRQPRLNPAFDGYRNVTLDIVQLGDRTDPGGVNADESDISAFLASGKRKLIHYHGMSDLTISPLASSQYYDSVLKRVGDTRTVRSSYRYFEIPGMSHCRDGAGPWSFGALTQNDPGNRPLKYDTRHDMLLSLVAWVERGLLPESQAGATYGQRSIVLPVRLGESATESSRLPTNFSSYEYGVLNTRRFCPYPTRSVYLGTGTTKGADAYKNFACK